MPWLQLTEAERAELHRRTRTPGLKPRTRDRLEMVRLADAGWTPPAVARHLRLTAAPVRGWLKKYLAGGFDALEDPPHQGRPSRLTPACLAAVRTLLDPGDRTWTTRQLTAWLAEEQGVVLSPDHLGRLLRQAHLSCRPTERTLHHKQDAEVVATFRADLETLEKGAQAGAWTCVT